MCLYAENDVLVGAAARLLAQEQTARQARRLARRRHVVRSPRLAVLVRRSRACAGGAVPDALLGPERQTENKHATLRPEVRLQRRRRSPEGVG